MRLMHGKLSPFTRKVMIFVHEKGLQDRVEIVAAAVAQGKNNAELMELNPIGKIPTLVTDDGQSIYDSFVICDYLEGLAAEPRLIPLAQARRTVALKINAIADGLIVAGVLAKLEQSKVTEKRWEEFGAAQWAKMEKCIEALSNELLALEAHYDIAAIGAICALGWVDARAPETKWRTRFPVLAAWFDKQHERPAVQNTRPPV